MDPVFMADLIPVYVGQHPYMSILGPVVPPAPMPPSPMIIHFEWPTTMWWPMGYAIGSNKLTETVRHQGFCFALEGHDVGPMIPHISVPPDNVMLVPTILGSKRKTNFSAGEVKADGKAVACCYSVPFPIGHIPTPMSFCSKPFDLLAGTGLAPMLHSLLVGQQWVELVADWAGLIADRLVSACTASINPPSDSTTMSSAVSSAAERFVWGGSPKDQRTSEVGAGLVSGIVRGAIRMAGQEWGGYRGDADIPVSVSSGPFQGGVHVRRTVDAQGDGTWSGGWSGRVGASRGANIHAEGEVSEASGGGVDLSGSGGVGLYGGTADGSLSTDEGLDASADHPLADATFPSLDDMPEL
ncbi:MAG: hypothetical protein KC619_20250 [Myxococcales bacterium]|nr:hypothetical protein [Myxococcales bacterium]